MTTTTIVRNWSVTELRDHLVPLALSLKLTKSALSTTDTHKSFISLKGDTYLKSVGITIKSINEHKAAKKAISELRDEVLWIQPSGGTISTAIHAVATNNLNSVINNQHQSQSTNPVQEVATIQKFPTKPLTVQVQNLFKSHLYIDKFQYEPELTHTWNMRDFVMEQKQEMKERKWTS